MTNNEIIMNVAKMLYMDDLEKIIMPNGDLGLHTYSEWKKLGYQVKKGEKAKAKVKLWKKAKAKAKAKESEDNGKVKLESEDSKVEKSRFFLANSALFDLTQVEKIEGE